MGKNKKVDVTLVKGEKWIEPTLVQANIGKNSTNHENKQ